MSNYTVRDGVAVISMNNPPMNTMSHANRSHVMAEVNAANADAAVKAIVLTAGGKVFSSGAEIREFNTPASFAEPGLREVITALEQSPKPVVAAVHGVAMGGGLELALGCHYRVASPGADALPARRRARRRIRGTAGAAADEPGDDLGADDQLPGRP